jgi:hypothetical protein
MRPLLCLLLLASLACETASPALPEVSAAAPAPPREASAEPVETRGPGESAGFAPNAASGDYRQRF